MIGPKNNIFQFFFFLFNNDTTMDFSLKIHRESSQQERLPRTDHNFNPTGYVRTGN